MAERQVAILPLPSFLAYGHRYAQGCIPLRYGRLAYEGGERYVLRSNRKVVLHNRQGSLAQSKGARRGGAFKFILKLAGATTNRPFF